MSATRCARRGVQAAVRGRRATGVRETCRRARGAAGEAPAAAVARGLAPRARRGRAGAGARATASRDRQGHEPRADGRRRCAGAPSACRSNRSRGPPRVAAGRPRLTGERSGRSRLVAETRHCGSRRDNPCASDAVAHRLSVTRTGGAMSGRSQAAEPRARRRVPGAGRLRSPGRPLRRGSSRTPVMPTVPTSPRARWSPTSCRAGPPCRSQRQAHRPAHSSRAREHGAEPRDASRR